MMLDNLNELINMIEVCNEKGQKREATLRPYLLYFTPMLIKDAFNQQEYNWYHIVDEVYIKSGKNGTPDGLFYDARTSELSFVEYKTDYIWEFDKISNNPEDYSDQFKNMQMNKDRLKIIMEFCNYNNYKNLISKLTDKVNRSSKNKYNFQKSRLDEFNDKPIKNVCYYHICYFLDYNSDKRFYYIKKYDFNKKEENSKMVNKGLLDYVQDLNMNYLVHFHGMDLVKYCLNVWKTPKADGESAISPYVAYMFNKYLGVNYINKIGIEINYYEAQNINRFKGRRNELCQADIGILTNNNDFIMFEIKLKNGENHKQRENYKLFLQDINSNYINYDNKNNTSIKEFKENNCKAGIAQNDDYIKRAFRGIGNPFFSKIKSGEYLLIKRACLVELSASYEDKEDVKSIDDFKNEIDELMDNIKNINQENNRYFDNNACNMISEIKGDETILKLSFNNLLNIIMNEEKIESDKLIKSLKDTLYEFTR